MALGLIGLGAFLLTGAAMLRWYAAPRAALAPLDPDVTITLTGSGTVYDLAAGAARPQQLTERVAIRGDAGVAGAAVWTVDRRLLSSQGVPLLLADERVALDRRTAAAVGCCGERPAHHGLTYLFPAGLARQDQQLYDPNTGRTAPARYTGTQTIAGQTTYRFDQSIPETNLRPGTLPGAAPIIGTPAPGRLTAASQRTLWVEPASGIVIRADEHRRQRLIRPDTAALTLLDVRLSTDRASQHRLAALAADRRGKLRALRTIAPAALAGTGLVMLLGGLGYRIVTMQGQSGAEGSTFGRNRW